MESIQKHLNDELPENSSELPKVKWPVMSGDYALGSMSECPVAIATIASEIRINSELFSIMGSVKTENLGVERVIANVIANPNIRFLIICGKESQGHCTAQTIKELMKSGIDEKKRVIGSKGAFPYIENVPREGIERFRKQVEIVDLVGEESAEKIESTARSCISRNPGSFGEPFVFLEVEEEMGEAKGIPENSVLIYGDVLYDYERSVVYVSEESKA
ncbi:MAG: tetrahydromethanopterin S-methyltransferase subunit A, partial [Candidatus Micrarchaeota archaeon]